MKKGNIRLLLKLLRLEIKDLYKHGGTIGYYQAQYLNEILIQCGYKPVPKEETI